MPGIIRKLIIKAKRRSRETRHSGLTFALYQAGGRLLAQYDCDDRRVSVARIAREAKVSIGTFYSRFRSKDAFIHGLTDTTFRAATNGADKALNKDFLGNASAEEVIRAVARHVVREIGEPKTAGILRAALKRAPQVSDISQPVRDYRTLVSDRARSLLGGRKKAKLSSRQIDAAIQMLFGTVIDAVVEQPGPLRAGRDSMADALGDMLVGYLGISSKRAWSPKKDKGERQDNRKAEGEETTPNDEEPPALPEGYAPIIDPDLGNITGAIKLISKPRRNRSAIKPAKDGRKIATISPSALKPAPKKAEQPSLKGRKRRFTIV